MDSKTAKQPTEPEVSIDADAILNQLTAKNSQTQASKFLTRPIIVTFLVEGFLILLSLVGLTSSSPTTYTHKLSSLALVCLLPFVIVTGLVLYIRYQSSLRVSTTSRPDSVQNEAELLAFAQELKKENQTKATSKKTMHHDAKD